jgi:hypothetical protein
MERLFRAPLPELQVVCSPRRQPRCPRAIMMAANTLKHPQSSGICTAKRSCASTYVSASLIGSTAKNNVQVVGLNYTPEHFVAIPTYNYVNGSGNCETSLHLTFDKEAMIRGAVIDYVRLIVRFIVSLIERPLIGMSGRLVP